MKEVPNYGGSGRSRVMKVVEFLSGAGENQKVLQGIKNSSWEAHSNAKNY